MARKRTGKGKTRKWGAGRKQEAGYDGGRVERLTEERKKEVVRKNQRKKRGKREKQEMEGR